MLNPDELNEALGKLDDGFDDLPLATKQSLLSAIVSKVAVLKEKTILYVKNPGFFLGKLDGVGLTGCYSGGQNLVYSREWLLRQDLNLRPSD